MHNPAGVSIATEEAISKADIFYHLLLFGIHKWPGAHFARVMLSGAHAPAFACKFPPPLPRLNCIFLSPGEYFSNWFDLGRLQLLVYISTSIYVTSLSLSLVPHATSTHSWRDWASSSQKLNWKPTEVICQGPFENIVLLLLLFRS